VDAFVVFGGNFLQLGFISWFLGEVSEFSAILFSCYLCLMVN
jgi:hypothetical protein